MSIKGKIVTFVPILFFAAIAFAPLFACAEEEFPEGSLWRASGDERIYIIDNGRKRHLTTPAVLTSYGWKAADAKEADPETIFGIPEVRVIKTADSSAVFDIISGKRVLIRSGEEFIEDGFTWDEVSVVNQTELESYQLVNDDSEAIMPTPTPMPPISATSAPVESVLLKKIAEARALLHTTSPLYPQEKVLATGGRTLKSGANGADVELLQKKLKELGYFPASVEANGNFGPTTERAVRSFQKAKGISAIGTVGPATMAALSKHGLSFGAKGTVVKSWRQAVPTERDVLLAAWNKDTDRMELVHVSLGSKRIKVGKRFATIPTVTSRTPGFTVRYKSGNGVNVQYSITSPAGYQVLVNRFPIFDAAAGKIATFPPSEEVYVPYSDEFRTAEIVEAGRTYLDQVVEMALGDLKTKGVLSVSGKGLVADLTDPDELKNIAIIEHMDYAEFRRSDDKHGVINKVFTILGTNREDAFRFSGSSKGALGLAQFIKNTYTGMVKQYPTAQLIPTFQEGMANHVNAIEAMSLYHDITGATLETYVKDRITAEPTDLAFALGEVRAAAYNGGAGRVKLALKKFGPEWSTTVSSRYGLRTETRSYLEKFRVVREILKTF